MGKIEPLKSRELAREKVKERHPARMPSGRGTPGSTPLPTAQREGHALQSISHTVTRPF